jgi:hypothetical protein
MDIRGFGEKNASENPTVDEAMMNERESFIVSMERRYGVRISIELNARMIHAAIPRVLACERER